MVALDLNRNFRLPLGRISRESPANLPCISQVDLNRNLDFHWDEGTDDSYAEDFRGTTPNSEPETKLIVGLVKSFKPKVFIDIHSGDASLMYP